MKAEVTVKSGDLYYRSSETTSDKLASLDAAVSGIERQIHKYKTRLEKRLRSGSLDSIPLEAGFELDPRETEPKLEIVRSKRFSIKPMTVEEACMQMSCWTMSSTSSATRTLTRASQLSTAARMAATA